jgi:hypothetical protein
MGAAGSTGSEWLVRLSLDWRPVGRNDPHPVVPSWTRCRVEGATIVTVQQHLTDGDMIGLLGLIP